MKLKRIKKVKINCHEFKVIWNKEYRGACFNYQDFEIEIGLKDNPESTLLMLVCHELQEICAVEMCVRYHRPDVGDDYLFCYDHRQHTTMMSMFSGALSQFLE